MIRSLRPVIRRLTAVPLALVTALVPVPGFASSHMDAPLVVLDPAANTTDVYAFVSSEGGKKYLVAALSVYPFEEPGIGPNKFNFDDRVLYEIHVATGEGVKTGEAGHSYQFRFRTRYKDQDTILQSYRGVVMDLDDDAQNLTQDYTVTRICRGCPGHRHRSTELGEGKVPPNNQGNATPLYNQGDDGEKPARDGVADLALLDRYTRQGIFDLAGGYQVFCGQREDGFYADIQAIFDLLKLRNPGVDSQMGFNLHTIVLRIPLEDLGGDRQVAGVYATTSRKRITILRGNGHGGPPSEVARFVQVGRQGNPLFCEGLVAIADKDLYNRTSPTRDAELFANYAESPELARLLNLLVLPQPIPGIETGRSDIAGIFIPDLIRVDLSTGPARLAGGGPSHPTTPDDPGYSRLGIFGGDVLISGIQEGFGGGALPGGWPNGRRFGDDVVDIAVTALISDLRVSPPVIRGPAGDNVDHNDAVYNKVMPYAGTPLNGRKHGHH